MARRGWVGRHTRGGSLGSDGRVGTCQVRHPAPTAESEGLPSPRGGGQRDGLEQVGTGLADRWDRTDTAAWAPPYVLDEGGGVFFFVAWAW